MKLLGAFMVPHPPLIVHEVGNGKEEDIKKTLDSYEQIAKEIGELSPDTIIISSPHAPFYSDCFYIPSEEKIHGSFSNFGASNVVFDEEYDIDLIDEIVKISKENNFPCEKMDSMKTLDHGSMVPLYFIRKFLKNYKIVVIGLSDISLEYNYKMGNIIRDAINKLDKKVVFVASGDLSHKLQEYGPYGFEKEGPVYDKRIMDIMGNARFNELLDFKEDYLDLVAECGHRSFIIMSGVLNGIKVKSKLYSHEDITGVGYGICSYYPVDPYVELAKNTIEEYIRNRRKIDIPIDISEELLNNKKGVFVSIHKNGYLRGCIGTILPTTNCVAQEIINNAISASTKDPRFNPIDVSELDDLEINVDVLTHPESVENISELDPKKYGVIVSSGFKRGVLLPDLEGVDTVDEQINIAKNKAGINNNEDFIIEKFQVIRHF